MDIKDKICKRIKDLRMVNNISMEQLAYRSGISKSNLSEIERGMTDTRISTIEKICEGLGINLNDFFNDSLFKNS